MLLVSGPVNDEALPAQVLSSFTVAAQTVGDLAGLMAEVVASRSGIDELDRDFTARFLAVDADDLLGHLVTVAVVIGVASPVHGRCYDNLPVRVVEGDEGI